MLTFAFPYAKYCVFLIPPNKNIKKHFSQIEPSYSLSKKNPHIGKEKAEGRLYAVAQHNGVVKDKEFAKKVSRITSGYNEYTVDVVMQAMAKCLRKLLLEGYRVELGPLGDFYTVINGTGSEN